MTPIKPQISLASVMGPPIIKTFTLPTRYLRFYRCHGPYYFILLRNRTQGTQ